MRPWMLEQPAFALSAQAEGVFQRMWAERNLALRPAEVPLWAFLDWLTRQGYLLHGSQQPDISSFEPRTPHDLSPDEFSKRRGVFASSDALWALMYALRGPRVRRMVNMALQVGAPGGWGDMRYFLSLATDDPGVQAGRDLLSPGWVYVLAADGFEQMRPYDWPGLGNVQEPQWIRPGEVTPLWKVAVFPEDFPLPVRLHDQERVDELCRADPWGFPWLEEGTGRQ
ncbi:hypothetical protein SAMN04488058_105132 [Deinococcus reticulitermitis]|uniref:Uncharacterized protein n=1 Tax=Deinococcus reticulitermitis TaxID=856736 RepID=A0A1H6X988_9DEIO|nr:hypothetical protein [Deinococcus reticulitermitis]SEJ25709.1 hypothetical protein SAMN04488058_105132 [Deinococcus reticulitermitis]